MENCDFICVTIFGSLGDVMIIMAFVYYYYYRIRWLCIIIHSNVMPLILQAQYMKVNGHWTVHGYPNCHECGHCNYVLSSSMLCHWELKISDGEINEKKNALKCIKNAYVNTSFLHTLRAVGLNFTQLIRNTSEWPKVFLYQVGAYTIHHTISQLSWVGIRCWCYSMEHGSDWKM